MLENIGEFLFRDVLKVYNYCQGCAPFTSDALTNVVLYFFIPSVLLILIVYMILARLYPSGYKGIKLLVGVGMTLFIIFSGAFSIFVYLGGPYFLFLLLVLGIIMYFLGHFRSGN